MFVHFELFIHICPNRFMLLLGLDKGKYCVHTCLLDIYIIYHLN